LQHGTDARGDHTRALQEDAFEFRHDLRRPEEADEVVEGERDEQVAQGRGDKDVGVGEDLGAAGSHRGYRDPSIAPTASASGWMECGAATRSRLCVETACRSLARIMHDARPLGTP
jgi:hypothetical protein